MWEERALPAVREKRVKNGRRRLHRITGSCGERRGEKSGCGASYRLPLERSASLEEDPNADSKEPGAHDGDRARGESRLLANPRRRNMISKKPGITWQDQAAAEGGRVSETVASCGSHPSIHKK